MKTLVKGLLENANTKPKKIAIIHNQETITYSELAGKIFGTTIFYQNLGIKKGDRIIVSATKNPLFIYGYYAAHLIGAAIIPLDLKIKSSSLEYIIGQTRPAGIFLHNKLPIDSTKKHPMETLDQPSVDSFNYSLPALNDIADIIFTTGTTGYPKGVVLTHENISAGAINTNEFIKNTANDREIVPLPFHHAFGLRRLRANLLVGGSVILLKGFMFPQDIFKAIENWNATAISIVPAGFQIMKRLTGEAIGKYKKELRYMEFGSSPMKMEDKKLLMKLLPSTKICMHYGLTEAAANIFIEFHESAHKLDSLGKASPNTNIMVSGEGGKPCKPLQTGEIWVKSRVNMKAYWNNPELTRHTVQEGWVKTGDLGYQDEEGYIYLKCRKDDILNIGGEKISPWEIETIINEWEEIEESAVTGQEDKKEILQLEAFLVLKKGKTDMDLPGLIAFMRQRLEGYKIPSDFKVVKTLPKTPTGKIKRNMLKN